MMCFVAVCLALASTAKALTAEQAASFFSTSSAGDLSGDTASLPRFDLTVVQNSSAPSPRLLRCATITR